MSVMEDERIARVQENYSLGGNSVTVLSLWVVIEEETEVPLTWA